MVIKRTTTPRSTYRIIAKEFCDKSNCIVLKLQAQGSNQIIIRTAGQLSLDKHLINCLSQEDAHCIGFIAGYEHALKKAESDD